MAIIIKKTITSEAGFPVTGAYVNIDFFQRTKGNDTLSAGVRIWKDQAAYAAGKADFRSEDIPHSVYFPATNGEIAAGNVFHLLYDRLKGEILKKLGGGEAPETVLGDDL
jgi:hypothetical protein